MWRTRLGRMYLPKVKQRDPNEHPMKVQNAQSFMRTAAVMAALTVIASAFLGLRQTQKRNRLTQRELLRRRRGRRVVIVGGGAGGAAVAAVMANAAPNLDITVIEKDRQQTFMGHVALANVGHRSYDIGTTTGVDLARSPATWNVTRDANLVSAEVLRVDPEAKKVYVRTTKAMLAVATAPRSVAESSDVATGDSASPQQQQQQPKQPGRGSGWVSGVLRRCWPASGNPSPEVISLNDDGSPNLSDGTTVYAYDALILAAGAQRSLGGLARQLRPDQLDTYRISVNPGTTRDNLVNLYSGTVLHVKVPPASFTAQMEAARALLRSPGGSGVPVVEVGPGALPLLSTATPSATSSTLPALVSLRERVAEWTGTSQAATLPAADDSATRIPDEVAARLQRTTAAPLYELATWCMHYSSRQHESTFVSSVNIIWKYLAYYSKLALCHYIPVTADTEPIGPAPAEVNGIIEAFWRERQLSCQHRSGSGRNSEDGSGPVEVMDRFHPLFHTYITSLDTALSVATLYDYKNDAEVRVPYHLLLLDLPLVAPAFVRESRLHRTRYVEECVIPALRHAAAESDVAAALRRHPLLGKSVAELTEMFADEASFADVDPFTLQHRRYPDIFAIGDIAGLPSLKSYGAVTTQVPVVAHNVRQVLQQQDALQAAAAASVAVGGGPERTPTSPLPAVNARYTGYSSFHVIMTTWRAMWPEVCYDVPQPTLKRVAAPPTDASLAATKRELDVVAPLPRCDHHIWNSLAWHDARGFFNGLFYEAALYEVVYFFLFSRGLWHSPSWFYVPTYSAVDGSPQLPTWRDLL